MCYVCSVMNVATVHTVVIAWLFNWHLQNAVFCVLFAIGFIAEGAASAANSADAQDNYYDEYIQDLCEQFQDEYCDDIEALIRSQSNAAVSTATQFYLPHVIPAIYSSAYYY